MFVIFNEKVKKPIKIWVEKESDIEESCLASTTFNKTSGNAFFVTR